MIPTIEDIIAGLLAGTYTKEQAIGWLRQHAHRDPEWWYDEDGESNADWTDIAEYCNLAPGGYIKVHGGMEVCTKYVGCVVKTLDDDGDPDETEYELFDTKEAAQKACEYLPTKG